MTTTQTNSSVVTETKNKSVKLTEKQIEHINFYLGHHPELKFDDLVPKNKWGSVYYELITKSDHFLAEFTDEKKCYVEGCDFHYDKTELYFVNFATDGKNEITQWIARRDGTFGEFGNHILDKHPTVARKKLKGITA